MNLFIQVYCIATILSKHWILANLDCSTINDESLRLDVAFNDIVSCNFISEAPEDVLTVQFGAAEANLGNNIPPARTVLTPCFVYEDADPGTNYTIIVLSIDEPSRAADIGDFLVYLSINNNGTEFGSSTDSSTDSSNDSCTGLCDGSSINSSTGSSTNSSTGFIVAPWIGPTARKGSGIHRVVAFVYEQDGLINTNDSFLVESTYIANKFDLVEFVNYYNLTGPIAGNFWTFCISADYCELCNNDTL